MLQGGEICVSREDRCNMGKVGLGLRKDRDLRKGKEGLNLKSFIKE